MQAEGRGFDPPILHNIYAVQLATSHRLVAGETSRLVLRRSIDRLGGSCHAMAEPETVTRPVVMELDAVLGQPFRVLNDGFVRVVDFMGSDASIVQAARVSYGAGTKHVSEDRGLIRYLMRHRHTTGLRCVRSSSTSVSRWTAGDSGSVTGQQA